MKHHLYFPRLCVRLRFQLRHIFFARNHSFQHVVCIFYVTQRVACQLLREIGSRDLVFCNIVRVVCRKCVHLTNNYYKNHALFANSELVVLAVKFCADKTAELVAIWSTCLSNIPTATARAFM